MSAVLGPLVVAQHLKSVPQLPGSEAAVGKSLGLPSLVAVKQNHADGRASEYDHMRLGHQHRVVLVVAASTTAARMRQDSVLQLAREALSTEEIALDYALVGPCSVVEYQERGVAQVLSARGFPFEQNAGPTEPHSLSGESQAACTGSTRTDLGTADLAARKVVHSSSALPAYKTEAD